MMARIDIARREEPRETKILKVSRDEFEHDALESFLSSQVRKPPESRRERAGMSHVEYSQRYETDAIPNPDFNNLDQSSLINREENQAQRKQARQHSSDCIGVGKQQERGHERSNIEPTPTFLR